MASELYVETLKGLTSGANANKVIVPAGQTLDASAGTLTPSSGQVVQVLQWTTTSVISTTSTSAVATNLIGTITPSSASNKILIQINGGSQTYASTEDRLHGSIYASIGGAGYSEIVSKTGQLKLGSVWNIPHSYSYLYSPNTTSEVKIQPYFYTQGGNIIYYNTSPVLTSLTLTEIAG